MAQPNSAQFKVASWEAYLVLSSPGSGGRAGLEINCDDNFLESFFTAPRLSLRSAIKRRRPAVPAFASSHPSHPLIWTGWWWGASCPGPCQGPGKPSRGGLRCPPETFHDDQHGGAGDQEDDDQPVVQVSDGGSPRGEEDWGAVCILEPSCSLRAGSNHGSQISKSIATPLEPPSTPPPPRPQCSSNLQKNATLATPGIRLPRSGSATRINWGTGPTNDLHLEKGLEIWNFSFFSILNSS